LSIFERFNATELKTNPYKPMICRDLANFSNLLSAVEGTQIEHLIKLLALFEKIKSDSESTHNTN